ncbi:hypothetical protein ElyMa_006868000 [Elysia marginata]|uniref:Uncharacterized protein n=1 Tax=Elysia marginata TaxID=1093978 RepID=A0AAV4J978_9GAST|nr:hypothetical protein ElyMa_006868000 [Elysia marginata]
MPMPVACRYMDNLVEHLKTYEFPAVEVTVGDICLCVRGIDLGFSTLLDLLLRNGCQENERVGAAQDADLESLIALTYNCLDILLQMLHTESGLRACLNDGVTFRAVTHLLMLAVFLACPVLPVEASRVRLARYVIRLPANRPSQEELSEKEKIKIRQKTLWQQREEIRRQREDLWLPDSTFTCIEIGKKDILLSSSDQAEAEVANETDYSSPHRTAGKSQTVESFCQKVAFDFKSECTGRFQNMVFFFCRGPYSGSQTFYDTLANVVSHPEPVCVGRHRFSHLILRELCLPLLWYVTTQECGSNPAPCEVPSVQDLQAQLDEFWLSAECSPQTQEVVLKMRQRGNPLPNQLLSLHLSEAKRILASGRPLEGDTDLALLHRVVEAREAGWRELLRLGLRNEDFQGWWQNGFFTLFWANEASLATEENVAHAVHSLGRAVYGYMAGLCDKVVVDNVKKLVSVMFQRLPIALQEQVVLLHLKNSKANAVLEGTSDDHSVPDESSSGQCLTRLMTEEQVVNELTFILNRLTMDTADQQVSFLLYLCLFHPRNVIAYLVRAAISTTGQTASVVKVLCSMPSICHLHELERKECLLVTCIKQEIGKLDVEFDEKQIQVVSNFLSTVTESFSAKTEDKYFTREIKASKVLSLAETLHSFVFPCLGKKSEPLPKESLESEKNDLHSYEGTLGVQKLSKPEAMKVNSAHIPVDGKTGSGWQQLQGSLYEDQPRESQSLLIALNTLELFLEKAVDENTFPVSEFLPFPLMVSLCDCYRQNYTILVEAAGVQRSQLQVCHRRKAHRLASHRCLTLLLQLVGSSWDGFAGCEKTWLFITVRDRGWLHAALLAPVLSRCEGWSSIQETGVGELCEAVVTGYELNTRRLVYLMQLAGVNNTMVDTVCGKLSKLPGRLPSDSLLVALKWILSTGVVEEMDRMVQVVKILLESCVKEDHDEIGEAMLFSQLEDKESVLCVRLCQALVDSAFLMVTDADSESVICHSLTNYQSALQSVLGCLNQAQAVSALPIILCLHCSVLAVTTGQAAQILQVTALDVLSRLKSAVTQRKQRRSGASGGVNAGSRVRENRELLEMLGSVSDCIACVEDAEVRLVLSNQLREVTV